VVDFLNRNSTTTTNPTSWQFSYAGWFIFLERFDRGQPFDMIIGSGPYTNANSNITGPHNPSLGTTMFEITGITGLSSGTVVSNVVVSFGASPYGYSSNCVCMGNNYGGNES
jgi:hypothetical protein